MNGSDHIAIYLIANKGAQYTHSSSILSIKFMLRCGNPNPTSMRVLQQRGERDNRFQSPQSYSTTDIARMTSVEETLVHS